MESLLQLVQRRLIVPWQEKLQPEIQVVLGGSLVSDLLLVNEQTIAVDVDVRFLCDHPEDSVVLGKVQSATDLLYRKTIEVDDWPSGTSKGMMMERTIYLPENPLPFEIEGCLRNRRYVGWHQYFHQVLSESELQRIQERKKELQHDKGAYKLFKQEVLALVKTRCLERGIVRLEGKHE